MKWWAEWILQASPELKRREAASIWYTGAGGGRGIGVAGGDLRRGSWSGRRRRRWVSGARQGISIASWNEMGSGVCWSSGHALCVMLDVPTPEILD
jgi:hypothetical protein